MHPKIEKYIQYKTNDQVKAEDILQDVFLTAVQKKDELMCHSCPEGWFYQTAFNIYRNAVRKNIIIQENETEFTENFIIEFDANNYSTDVAENILFVLSEKNRELLEMQFYEGWSLKEIAAEKNVSYESLRKYNYRLLKKIGKKFSEN